MSSWLGVVPRSFCCTAEVDRFCLQILLSPVRVNQEKITEHLESVPGVLVVSRVPCCPVCLWPMALLGRHSHSSHTPASTAADFTLLKCLEKSVMPSLLLSLCFSSSFLFYRAFSVFSVFFNKFPRVQCQLSPVTFRLMLSFGWKVKIPGSAESAAGTLQLWAPFTLLLTNLSSMNSLSDNNCPPLIQAQRCVPHENKENQNQMVSVYINSFPKYVTLLSV